MSINDLFINLTRLSDPIILTSINYHTTFTEQTKYIAFAPGIVGRYYGMPTVLPKSKISSIGTAKIMQCGINEGWIKFDISPSGIDIAGAKDSNSALQVIIYG